MTAAERANGLRKLIVDLNDRLEQAKKELVGLERVCRHQWSEPKYVPEYRPAYTIPGDPPGTMGVDWRGPCHVPAQTIERWTRTCSLCSKTETTERTTDVIDKKPVF